ncbi:MAG: bifunctional [glutamate--ammonia ligase]-adenylyl-L-tyrosine phosphorylase/[glutamate--ammonia-ligase] adenylyltransferase, partial [Candidatus Accumulibacter sp.]|nr:bifunctional [glutamate--ammonia ligase]-adenylyl-L-tyrosine phosphorylase/[glutamate--ammonia-ligase] adenylyltransferase [Accumulibacter sp.]
MTRYPTSPWNAHCNGFGASRPAPAFSRNTTESTHMHESDFPESWQPALTHSRFLRQLLAARPDVADWARDHAGAALSGHRMRDFLANETVADEDGLKRALRRLRQRVMAALMVRDLGGQAPLGEVFETMSALAEVVTNHALDFLHRRLAAQFGEPLDRQGRPQRLLVVGMGKLGGRELNVSSDVDYIFVYPEDGETAGTPDGGRKIEVFDFFTRLGKRLIAAIDEITGDGQVFRVDMRLRPNGDSGALVASIVSLEYYFVAQGREWERYAWIKARVMNEGDNLQTEWRAALERAVYPFVYRKYLDFGAIDAMRELHAQIRREVVRKDRAEHIKLGHGGIREIEFMAQVFQLIRGGRDAALRVRPTLEVLPLLVARRQLPADGEHELVEAYVFLRRLEHRLQYVNDAQTHMLPTDEAERERIARSMNFTGWPSLLAVLETHRQRVARHFEEIFSEPGDGAHDLAALWFGQIGGDDALEVAGNLGFGDPAAMLERLRAFRRGGRYQQLDTRIRQRLDAIGPRLIEAAAATRVPDATW